MSYPTEQQIESASREQICSWYRFLPSPGSSAIAAGDYGEFQKLMKVEAPLMRRIATRYDELGEITPTLSKALGWPATEG